MTTPITSESLEVEGFADHDAFRLLSDDTRLDILQALGEAYDPSDQSPVRFSELRERVGAHDPGRLNYHLNELRTHFVRRTEAGYELREAGTRILRVLLSGTAVADPEVEPVAVDVSCWFCGGQTELSYRDGWRFLECSDCDARCVDTFPPGVLSKTEVPPSVLLDRTPTQITDADRIWAAHRRASVLDGVCPECAGPMPVSSIDVCHDHRPDWDTYRFCDACGSIFRMLVSHVCDVCTFSWRLPTLFYPTRHPAVVAFYYDHGIELDLANHEQRTLLLDYEEELLDEDPLRIRITIPMADEELRMTFDDRMDVEDVTRRARTGG